jgi:hypothetical protein
VPALIACSTKSRAAKTNPATFIVATDLKVGNYYALFLIFSPGSVPLSEAESGVKPRMVSLANATTYRDNESMSQFSWK